MKQFKFITNVISISRYDVPTQRISPKGAETIITHKAELALTPYMKKCIEESEKSDEFLRVDSTGNKTRATFGVVNSAGNLVITLTSNSAKKLADTAGVSVSQLPLSAKNGRIEIDFDLRVAGEKVSGLVRTADGKRVRQEVPIQVTHLAIQGLNLELSAQARMELLASDRLGELLARSFGQYGHSSISSPTSAGGNLRAEVAGDEIDAENMFVEDHRPDPTMDIRPQPTAGNPEVQLPAEGQEKTTPVV